MEPDGSLKKITSSVELNSIAIFPIGGKKQQSTLGPFYKLVFVGAKKIVSESESDNSEDDEIKKNSLNDLMCSVTINKTNAEVIKKSTVHNEKNNKSHQDTKISKESQFNTCQNQKYSNRPPKFALPGKRNYNSNNSSRSFQYSSGCLEDRRYLNNPERHSRNFNQISDIEPWSVPPNSLPVNNPISLIGTGNNQIPINPLSSVPNFAFQNQKPGLLGNSPHDLSQQIFQSTPVCITSEQSYLPIHQNWGETPVNDQNLYETDTFYWSEIDYSEVYQVRVPDRSLNHSKDFQIPGPSNNRSFDHTNNFQRPIPLNRSVDNSSTYQRIRSNHVDGTKHCFNDFRGPGDRVIGPYNDYKKSGPVGPLNHSNIVRRSGYDGPIDSNNRYQRCSRSAKGNLGSNYKKPGPDKSMGYRRISPDRKDHSNDFQKPDSEELIGPKDRCQRPSLDKNADRPVDPNNKYQRHSSEGSKNQSDVFQRHDPVGDTPSSSFDYQRLGYKNFKKPGLAYKRSPQKPNFTKNYRNKYSNWKNKKVEKSSFNRNEKKDEPETGPGHYGFDY